LDIFQKGCSIKGSKSVYAEDGLYPKLGEADPGGLGTSPQNNLSPKAEGLFSGKWLKGLGHALPKIAILHGIV
jgi:hypothetical protein